MVLAVFAGLPGVGKSTLAAQVAAELPAAVLAVDTVDFTLQRYDVHEPRPGFAAYGVVAALVLETVGPQEYEVKGDFFAKRIADSYGDEAAAEIRPFLPA